MESVVSDSVELEVLLDRGSRVLAWIRERDLVVLECQGDRGARAVEVLEETMEADTRSPHTRQAYKHVWKLFLDYCYTHRLRLVNVRALHVSAWIKVHPGSKSTKRQHLSALRKLFAKLLVKGLVKENPAKEVRLERFEEDSSPTPIFDSGEIAKFLGSIRTDSLQGIRDKALFSVLLYSWCRVSALLSLRVEDWYFRELVRHDDGREIRVRHRWLRLKEKRGKVIEVPAHSQLVELLDNWLAVAGIADKPESPIFLSLGKDHKTILQSPLDRRSVFKLVRKRAKQCEILKDVGCHSFRATSITEYMNQPGATLEMAQRIAGHKNIVTTKRYDRSRDRLTIDEIERVQIGRYQRSVST